MKRPLRGEPFLLNPLGQNVSMFPIAEGENIEKGDLVVVNTRTLQAGKAKKESGYYAVGRAAMFVKNEYGTNSVICTDGIFIIQNTDLPEHKICNDAVGRVCYFDGSDSVTLDNINTTKAGEILNVAEDGNVLVKISIREGSELEW